MVLYLLSESSAGYALFEHVKSSSLSPQDDDFTTDFSKFGLVVKLKSFVPFESAEQALENQNAVSEGDPTAFLLAFLTQHVVGTKSKGDKDKEKDKDKTVLGVLESKLASALSDVLSIKCRSDDQTAELFRGIRLHFERFLHELKGGDWFQSQLGLAHSYSRSKVKFNVHRVDNMIIQSSALLDQLDKDLNTFSMRVREWYSYHFPELLQVVPDHYQYAQCAFAIKDKAGLVDRTRGPALVSELSDILQDDEKAKQIVEASKMSMGQEISPIDLINIESFSQRVVKLSEYRRSLYAYLVEKMNLCAPNLSSLIGELVGARLIAHAGSLTNLAKYPASTVQILGAEKALFRALKTKSGQTPKFGLLFHSTFIGRAGPKNKGRISRYLANKCSLAARIDCFSDVPTNVFGIKLRQQVEDRLEFYKTGKAPAKNSVVMAAASAEAREQAANGDAEEHKEEEEVKEKKDKKKDRKRKAEEPATAEDKNGVMEDDEGTAATAKAKKAKKDKKKDKKREKND